MVFKQFRLQVSLRVFLIVLSAFIFSFFLQKELIANAVFVFALIWYQVWLLLQKLNSIAFDLRKFLDSINYDDLTQTFTINNTNEAKDDLNKTFQKALNRFRDKRSQRESDLQFYKSIAQQLDTAIVAFDTSGKVVFSNKTTKRLFTGVKSSHVLDFEDISEELFNIFNNKDEEGIYHCTIPGMYAPERVVVQKMLLYVKGEMIHVYSISRVEEEVEKVEIQAWEALISVLTHEIMNAIAPVASLSDTVKGELEYLKDNYDKEVPTKEEISDLISPMETISHRVSSLSTLAENFRVLAHLRESQFEHFNVNKLCEEAVESYQSTYPNVKFELQLQQESILVTADPLQIRSVIDAVVKNAVEELETSGAERASVVIRSTQDENKNKPIIRIIDNGSGIDSEAQNKIFIPFYTTKKDHVGIGLSLSRQIMRRNNGRLTLKTALNEGSEFTLRF
ncbi:ATP-binding protein [Flammeovirga sp. MY04]|uniref:sensor histidine kinase n=1 Tax=Flammeovirga sp. MY04 TaxID=1191459 RepID=UPI0008062B6B|nr:ATP-binding protein [Flammeovirga sp. MY04]ANQ52426.1 ATP-binding protein [Flammeovirga sp. MY04]